MEIMLKIPAFEDGGMISSSLTCFMGKILIKKDIGYIGSEIRGFSLREPLFEGTRYSRSARMSGSRSIKSIHKEQGG
jgi:hypothetical protein